MTVYVVAASNYDEYEIDSIWTDRARAEARLAELHIAASAEARRWADRFNRRHGRGDTPDQWLQGYTIVSYELDTPHSPAIYVMGSPNTAEDAT